MIKKPFYKVDLALSHQEILYNKFIELIKQDITLTVTKKETINKLNI